jgi:hypothetical protein
VLKSQTAIGFCVFIVGIWVAWQAGEKIASNNLSAIEFAAFGFAACTVAVVILRSWRRGFYLFIIWMLFEDLARKYLGNNLVLFFAKDVLLALVFFSFLLAARRDRERVFRPSFLLPLAVFFWLGAIQLFNQNSPHILYGLLGIKVYFYYVPLMFVGYALIRNDEDLRKFLALNVGLGGLIGLLGIIQAIVGHNFLNPTKLAPELMELGELDKVTPLSNQLFSLPTSVFVSNGRFANYLMFVFIFSFGAAGYLLLHTRRSRKLVFLSIAIVGVAVFFSGSRGALMFVLISAIALVAGLLWGAPWRWQQAHRLVKVIRRSAIVATVALAAALFVFPEEAGSRIAFYAETLLPNSQAFAVRTRSWDYPIQNLLFAFDGPNWVFGNGIGTASLGTQYVAKVLHQPPPNVWVEEGYGVLIVELGIVAPFLWIAWTAALLLAAWKVVRELRETRFFPIGFAIFWYAFLLLYPLTYGSLASYQNYIGNAYFWLLVGVLFKLPVILGDQSVPSMVSSRPLRHPLERSHAESTHTQPQTGYEV